MSEKEAKTVFIGGHEIDKALANELFGVIRNSVSRVAEEMAIRGCEGEKIKAATISTAEAIVGTFVDVCKKQSFSSSSHHPLPERQQITPR